MVPGIDYFFNVVAPRTVGSVMERSNFRGKTHFIASKLLHLPSCIPGPGCSRL